MFLKDAVQNPTIIVDLPDIDESTLRSLLLYIYKDVVEDLEFGNAMELYQAADKYQLTDLKNICAKVLVGNLCRSSIFQVLSFANIYQDDKMKKAAQDFISDIDNDFTSSDEWQDFKKRNLELAMETMEYMFSRKRIKIDN
ncbi:hypothetical protein AVEN_9994-1 [Araneus ventricosus]|uniref:BTB domain-containing protein n=1 Tax=Araneus ventricosus TaxID=182803 RepID=A0A4Y2LDF0_ARAVE|nr:hypothetical protein AVEN_9994-1 [Araneus ventricosus]